MKSVILSKRVAVFLWINEKKVIKIFDLHPMKHDQMTPMNAIQIWKQIVTDDECVYLFEKQNRSVLFIQHIMTCTQTRPSTCLKTWWHIGVISPHD